MIFNLEHLVKFMSAVKSSFFLLWLLALLWEDLQDCANVLFLFKQTSVHQPLGLLITSAWISHYCEGCHLHLLVDFLLKTDVSLSSHPFIYLHQYVLMDFCSCSVGFISYHILFYFDAQIVLDVTGGSPWRWLSVSFWRAPPFEQLLTFEHKRFQAYLSFSCVGSGVRHFPQESWLLSVEVVARNADMDA